MKKKIMEYIERSVEKKRGEMRWVWGKMNDLSSIQMHIMYELV